MRSSGHFSAAAAAAGAEAVLVEVVEFFTKLLFYMQLLAPAEAR